jgi:hypothetical protein
VCVLHDAYSIPSVLQFCLLHTSLDSSFTCPFRCSTNILFHLMLMSVSILLALVITNCDVIKSFANEGNQKIRWKLWLEIEKFWPRP